MKRHFVQWLIAATAFTSIFSALAQTKSVSSPSGSGSAALGSSPRIQFVSTLFDFGKIISGDIVRHEFIFTNSGTAALEITDVRPGCGCTTAGDWDRRVKPGMAGIVPLRFNSAGLSGEITKSATVTCNDPDHFTVLLQFIGTVWKPIEITPPRPSFTVSEDGQTNQIKIVRIVNNLDEPLTLSDLQCTNSSFRMELKTVQPGKEFELRITAVPPFAPPSVFAPITLKTSSSVAPEIRVMAQLIVQPAVAVLPNRIMLPKGALTTAIGPGVTIRNNGTNALVLADATLNVPGAEVHVQELQTNRLFRLTVNFPAEFQIKSDEKIEVSVGSNHPKYPVIRVPVVQSQRSPFPGATTEREKVQE
jgi:hypothetical protein